MKKTILSSFAIVAILLSTHCTLRAQWVRVNCPVNPQTLIVRKGYLFVGSEYGVVRSSDNGVNWTYVNNGLHHDMVPSSVRSLCSYGNNLIAGADYMEGLFISTNNGNFWNRDTINSGGYGFPPDQVGVFSIHNGLIFATSGNSPISRSIDTGKSWVTIDSGLTLDGLRTSCVSSNSDFVFCGNDNGQMYRSTNGDRWSLIYQNSFPDIIYTITANGSTIFAQEGDTIMRSLDNGDHWEKVKKRFGTNTFIVLDNVIFAGGYFGVIYSSDNGDTWNAASQGLPDSVVIDAFVIKDGYLYTGAYETLPFSSGGLWRRPLSDFGINSVKNLSQPYPNISLSPNPTTGIITVHNASANILHVTVSSILGESVLELEHSNAPEFTLDLSKLPPGIYFARFVMAGEVVTRKIIRE